MNEIVPFFSIIIPTYNRPEKLRTCLDSLAKLEYPRDRFEVIVVDDGSSLSLEPVVASFRELLPVRLVSQPNAGPAAARNTGSVHAKGELLAYTDDDCTPDSKWLRIFANQFISYPDHLIGGRMVNLLPGNLYSEASQQLISYLYDYYNRGRGRNPFFASSNIALPARLFHEVGGFDATFPLAAGEDREFCDRWLHHGYLMIYAPEAVVYHSHVLNLRRFCRQHFNYGRGAFRFHQIHAQRKLERIRLEPLSFYLNLLHYPFRQTDSLSAIILAAILFVSQGVNAAGFFYEKLNRRIK